MKKLGITIFAAFAMLFATDATAQEPAKTQTVKAERTIQNDFKEVASADVPTAIQLKAREDFQAPVKKAWVKTKGDQKIYKLEITVNGDKKVVFANENGEWIKKGKSTRK